MVICQNVRYALIEIYARLTHSRSKTFLMCSYRLVSALQAKSGKTKTKAERQSQSQELGVSFSFNLCNFANDVPITSIEIISKVGMPDILQGSR